MTGTPRLSSYLRQLQPPQPLGTSPHHILTGDRCAAIGALVTHTRPVLRIRMCMPPTSCAQTHACQQAACRTTDNHHQQQEMPPHLISHTPNEMASRPSNTCKAYLLARAPQHPHDCTSHTNTSPHTNVQQHVLPHTTRSTPASLSHHLYHPATPASLELEVEGLVGSSLGGHGAADAAQPAELLRGRAVGRSRPGPAHLLGVAAHDASAAWQRHA